MAKKRKQLDGRQEVMRGFAEAAADRGQHFFYVLIHEPLGPMVDRVYGMGELVVEDCHGLRLACGEDPGRSANWQPASNDGAPRRP